VAVLALSEALRSGDSLRLGLPDFLLNVSGATGRSGRASAEDVEVAFLGDPMPLDAHGSAADGGTRRVLPSALSRVGLHLLRRRLRLLLPLSSKLQ